MEVLKREAREHVEVRVLIFCGISKHSAVNADLERGGLKLNYGALRVERFDTQMLEMGPLGFEDRVAAIDWCKNQVELELPLDSQKTGLVRKINPTLPSIYISDVLKDQSIESDEDAVKAFMKLSVPGSLLQELYGQLQHGDDEDGQGNPEMLVAQIRAHGGNMKSYQPGQLIDIEGWSRHFIQLLTFNTDEHRR